MVYWITNSITSSMRFYKESLPMDPVISRIPLTTVPTAFAAFPQELFKVGASCPPPPGAPRLPAGQVPPAGAALHDAAVRVGGRGTFPAAATLLPWRSRACWPRTSSHSPQVWWRRGSRRGPSSDRYMSATYT
jgi:hypothetical protein